MSTDQSKFATLRRRAESVIESLSTQDNTSDGNNAEQLEHDAMRLLHELEVHQVELELQNQELEKAQEALLASRNAFKDLFDNAPLAYFIIDKKGVVQSVNAQASNLLGVGKKQLVGEPFVRYVGAEDKDTFYLHQRQVLFTDSDEIVTVKMILVNNDGDVLDVQLTSTPLPDKETFRCAVADISDLQRAHRETETALQKQQELNTLRTRFMASIMHELRTPLSIVMSATQMLDRYYEQLSDEKREEKFNKIYDNVMYLTEVAQEVAINFNEERFARAHPPEEPISVRDIFTQIVDHWQEGEREITLSFDLADKDSLSLWDMRTLRRIMYNLLDNAKKYSDDVIDVRISSDADQLQIQVSDTGRGISEDDLTHIFEPLFRGQNAQDARGIGIGLYTVKNTVDTLSGTIDVDSRSDKGTTFTVRLPLNDKGEGSTATHPTYYR